MKAKKSKLAIVSFHWFDPRNENHTKSLVYGLGVQFIVPEKKEKFFSSNSNTKRPYFDNDIFLSHYENDIERLNTYFSIFDFNSNEQVDKVLGFFLNEKILNYKPYIFCEEFPYYTDYLYAYSSYPYNYVDIFFIEKDNSVVINEEEQTYKRESSKQVFKIGSTQRINNGRVKGIIFNRRNRKHIEKVFQSKTWYKEK